MHTASPNHPPHTMTEAHLALLAYAVYRAPPGKPLLPLRAIFGLQRAGYVPAPSSTSVYAPNFVRCMCCGATLPNAMGLHTPVIIGCSECFPSRAQVLEAGIAAWELQDLWHMLAPEHWLAFERHAQAASTPPTAGHGLQPTRNTLQPTEEPKL